MGYNVKAIKKRAIDKLLKSVTLTINHVEDYCRWRWIIRTFLFLIFLFHSSFFILLPIYLHSQLFAILSSTSFKRVERVRFSIFINSGPRVKKQITNMTFTVVISTHAAYCRKINLATTVRVNRSWYLWSTGHVKKDASILLKLSRIKSASNLGVVGNSTCTFHVEPNQLRPGVLMIPPMRLSSANELFT